VDGLKHIPSMRDPPEASPNNIDVLEYLSHSCAEACMLAKEWPHCPIYICAQSWYGMFNDCG